MNYAVAVLDIGKTNKKVALYDDSMKELAVRKRKIETMKVNNLDVENVEEVEKWFLEQLKELSSEYPIKALSITTHGATVVCTGEDGKPSVPTVAYTNEVPESFHEEFWNEMGDPGEIQKITATAEIKPLINIAELLWFMKKQWPEDFSKTRNILFYPQYFGYRLTGKVSADITYTGCHTYLWDYTENDWSFIADKLGIRDMLPEKPGNPADELGVISKKVAEYTGLSPDTKVTLGIHDSNSSLIPYIITQDKDFVLNSTGTWCVAMHPVDKVSFKEEEIGKLVYYNLSYKGEPVKTSILMGGLELETYVSMLMKHHNRTDWPVCDHKYYREIINQKSSFVLPSIIRGAGQFPYSVPRVIDNGKEYLLSDLQNGSVWPEIFNDYIKGFAMVNLSIAIQTKVALERVGLEKGTEVFIEGGFRQNKNYAAVLSALLPDNPLFLTELGEATSFGAALCGKSLLDNVEIDDLSEYVKLDKQSVGQVVMDGLNSYVEEFLKLAEK